ncbi:MAG TPA: hypothetical protein PKL44_03110 [Candidatus Dojkabacteria bacterium]|nr:hypothetical protein [Candidatus Dojkabacteria bacterium]
MIKIPKYGDMFTLEKFIEYCKAGCFTDYDGHGNYSDGKQLSDIEVVPSDVREGNIKKEWSHVLWFNR